MECAVIILGQYILKKFREEQQSQILEPEMCTCWWYFINVPLDDMICPSPVRQPLLAEFLCLFLDSE